jgi:rhodanese-related sulfurtransferase
MLNTTDKPGLQEFHLPGVKHINPEHALKAIENDEAILIDVREENEVMLEHMPLPNVLNHPMSVIMDRLTNIPKEANIILGCPKGVRSSKVANLLNRLGYPNIANLDGGFKVWKARKLPWETIFATDGDCGCNCSSCGESSDGCC